jgi:methyl-accepting chemotaxis protein
MARWRRSRNRRRSRRISRALGVRSASVVAGVGTSRDTVARLAGGVETALKNTRDVLDLLATLNDTGRQIEKITDGLALIAVQTNMLAVSGAVEATRAAEAGRRLRQRRQRYPQAVARIRAQRRARQGCRCARSRIRSPCGAISIRSPAAAESEIARNRAMVERFKLIAADLAGAQAASRTSPTMPKPSCVRRARSRAGPSRSPSPPRSHRSARARGRSAARQQSQGAELLAAAIEEIASLADALMTKAA